MSDREEHELKNAEAVVDEEELSGGEQAHSGPQARGESYY
jgi:hypothetical protein